MSIKPLSTPQQDAGMWSSTSGWTPSSTERKHDEDGGVEIRTDAFGGGSVGLFATRTFEAGSTVVSFCFRSSVAFAVVLERP